MDHKEEILSRLTSHMVYGSSIVKGSGKWEYKTCCPFHNEKTPSFMILTDLSFHCFGCGASGDAFTFIMKRHNVDFFDALKFLANMADVKLSDNPGQFARLYDLNKAAMEFYQECLKKNEIVTAYLTETRGFTQESIDRFHLGCTNGASVVKVLKAKGFSDDEILGVGIGRKRDGKIHDYFWDHVIFPIIQREKVKGFGGRARDNSEPKYLNSPTTVIFKKGDILYGLDGAAIKTEGFAIVVEGNPDVIMCHQHGHTNATACLGTAFGEQHIELLRKYTDTLYLVFDGDSAGRRAAKSAAKLCFEKSMKGGVAILPEGEDPDSFLRKGGSLGDVIAVSRPFAVFFSKEFPESRMMIRNMLLTREPLEVEEFFSYGCSSQEMKVYYGLRSRDVLQELFGKAKLILEVKDIQVRKYAYLLGLFRKGNFVYAEKVADTGKYKKQSQDIVERFMKLLHAYEEVKAEGIKK